MTEINVSTLTPPADPYPAPNAGDIVDAPISFTRKVVRLTFERIGAQLGLFWIVLIMVLAVFAPLLANSHPLAMKSNGQWSSPLVRALTPTDVTFVGIVIVTAVVSYFTVKPPLVQVYDTYRNGLVSGEISKAIFVPIHYSPD